MNYLSDASGAGQSQVLIWDHDISVPGDIR